VTCSSCHVTHSANEPCADAVRHELEHLRAKLVEIAVESATIRDDQQRITIQRLVRGGLRDAAPAQAGALDIAKRVGAFVPLLIAAVRTSNANMVAHVAQRMCGDLARLLREYRLDLAEVLPQEVCTRCAQPCIDFRRTDGELICVVCIHAIELGALVPSSRAG
jgi:hypothetical protein